VFFFSFNGKDFLRLLINKRISRIRSIKEIAL